MRVVFWGTYDTGKPRVRILLQGLRENGVDVVECHREVWGGVEDKSQISGLRGKLWFAIRWISSYPWLLWHYVRMPTHDAVIVGYLGHLDVLILWPFAKLRGVPVVWDAFLSLYNTVVEDRGLVGRRNPVAMLLYAWEWLACRAASLVLLDTRTHAQYFVERFKLPPTQVADVLVGVESEQFLPRDPNPQRTDGSPITVLFYGQFIPLHGIETIIRAARLAESENIDWVLIGKGQEAPKIRSMLEEEPRFRVRWIPWVPYEKLIDWIHRADICLGIFGDTSKAASVIPNKAFQIIAAGKPLITRESAAIHELVHDQTVGAVLIPPQNPEALLDAVWRLASQLDDLRESPLYVDEKKRIVPAVIGARLVELLTHRDIPALAKEKET